MTKSEFLELSGDFTWNFNLYFFIELSIGSFVWSDPDYGGDNSFRKVDYSYKEWCRLSNIPYGRCKGKHRISDYCGRNIRVLNFNLEE